MRFPYTVNIAPSVDTGEEIVLLRPEVTITIHGPSGRASVLALVDSGADNTIFPLKFSRMLGIETTKGKGPGALAFGGQQIALSYAEVLLVLRDRESAFRWRTRVYFSDSPTDENQTAVLGHEGFLEFFDATFLGEECVLELVPNESFRAL